MAQKQVRQFYSSLHGTTLNVLNMADTGALDVNLDIANTHAHEAISFQIECSPAGNFDFSISFDSINFIATRVWDIANLIHTTSASSITRSLFTANIAGARIFRITKSGSPANTVATIHARNHKQIGSHSQRTRQ